MIQILEAGNTMQTKRMDDLRSAALEALIRAGLDLPRPVITYFQAVEADLLERDHRHRLEFAASSWEQFVAPAVDQTGGAG